VQVEVQFWLLDVNYEVREHKPEMWIWGIDNHGKRVLILDCNFPAHFYAVIKKGKNPQAVVEKILSRKREFPFIIRLESTEKKFLGKLADTLVVCQDSNLIPKYAKAFLKKGLDISLGTNRLCNRSWSKKTLRKN